MRRCRHLARPWRRDIGRRRVAGVLEAGATGTDLTLTGALNVDGAVDFDGALDVAGATLLRSTLEVDGVATFDGAADFDAAVDMSADLTLSGTAQLHLAAGTPQDPSVTFAGDLDMGLYATAAGVLRLAIAGANTISWTTETQSMGVGLDVGGYLTLNAETSPAAIGTDQDNYSANLQDSWLRLTASAAVNITGLAASNGDGRVLPVVNIGGTHAITLKHENASSTAANRFALPSGADLALGPGDGCILIYDAVSSRWRVWGVAL